MYIEKQLEYITPYRTKKKEGSEPLLFELQQLDFSIVRQPRDLSVEIRLDLCNR